MCSSLTCRLVTHGARRRDSPSALAASRPQPSGPLRLPRRARRHTTRAGAVRPFPGASRNESHRRRPRRHGRPVPPQGRRPQVRHGPSTLGRRDGHLGEPSHTLWGAGPSTSGSRATRLGKTNHSQGADPRLSVGRRTTPWEGTRPSVARDDPSRLGNGPAPLGVRRATVRRPGLGRALWGAPWGAEVP